MNRKANADILHILVGILLIGGGIAYIFNQTGLGLVIASIGLLTEAIVNWLGKII
jgi:hypothetical protein